jgi:PKHD-type hydroxylase
MHLLCIADVLSPAVLAAFDTQLDALPWADGRDTAGWAARTVKRNEQAAPSPVLQALQDELRNTLLAHPLVRLYARPQRVSAPLLSRYRDGMHYGRHVDDALMGDPPLRTDLAFTLFLAPPESYDGGELVLEGHDGETPVKLPAGSLVLYATGQTHRVNAVTRGERRAAVGWIQSQVRDPAQRDILFDLDRTRRALFERDGASNEFDALSRSSAALLRMWAEV